MSWSDHCCVTSDDIWGHVCTNGPRQATVVPREQVRRLSVLDVRKFLIRRVRPDHRFGLHRNTDFPIGQTVMENLIRIKDDRAVAMV
ncbi:hypothetical protein VWZ88_10310 [Phaeobacter sp. JH20_36]|uniref:hypothetical protein n=1 Tax=unclassified Phaeobacter TaxID=2621772 RepID=UPI003A8693C8